MYYFCVLLLRKYSFTTLSRWSAGNLPDIFKDLATLALGILLAVILSRITQEPSWKRNQHPLKYLKKLWQTTNISSTALLQITKAQAHSAIEIAQPFYLHNQQLQDLNIIERGKHPNPN